MDPMYVPVISKTSSVVEVLVERALPVPGQILVTENTEVAPYEHLGICTFSQKTLKLPKHFHPSGFKKNEQYYYVNTKLGSQGGTKITSPFNGNLVKLPEGGFEYREESKKYILLSGIWGDVIKVVEKNSCLIKTRVTDVNLTVATKTNFAGELVVFPNPTRLLERFYLEGFASDSADGKIVYVGNHVSLQFLKDSVKYGIGAIIGGSADRETFKFAAEAGVNFGVFSGFGDLSTPEEVYSFLNSVASRYVFFQGERHVLRIPMPKEDQIVSIKAPNTTPIKKVEKGMDVLVLQRPYFGKTGVVDSVKESSIFVRFSINESPIEVFTPNFFLV